MNNNTLLFLLPFLMNGSSGNMNKIMTEMLKNQQTSLNPMTLLLLSMLNMKQPENKSSTEEGAEAVKGFGGDDVLNLLQILMQNKNQSV